MIGGAFAARLIDLSRHRDTLENIRCVERLYTVEGITAIFRQISTQHSVYHCIRPWGLLRPAGDGEEENLGVRRRAERTYICETISRCLEDMYSNIGG
jgi:hypothetical protein